MVLRKNGASDPLGESTFSRKASEGIGSNLLQQNPPLQQRSNETAELRATPIAAAGFAAPTCKSAGPNSWGQSGFGASGGDYKKLAEWPSGFGASAYDHVIIAAGAGCMLLGLPLPLP